jgi:hypothetical protein
MSGDRHFVAMAALCLGFAAAAPDARALVLDWGSVSWTPGSTSNSYNVDPSHPGNDITVTFSGRTDELTTGPDGLLSPAINTVNSGGNNPAVPALNIAMDFGREDRLITITVSFAAHYPLGVEGVSFSIFGIDRPGAGNNFIDQIRLISATGVGGQQIAPTITNVGSAVSLTGSGLSQRLTGTAEVPRSGAGSENGNATISFNGPIRSFTFSYGNDSPAMHNPWAQDISISNITFSPVPEINPAAAAAGASLVAALLARYARARARRQS